jgi:CubicO group peptidase (beta-lactamase class C family)
VYAAKLEGVRLLGPKTVELMAVNHVASLYAEGTPGFGRGFDVTEDLGRAGRHGSVGAFGWGGAYHTTYRVDPQEKLVAALMTQLLPAGDSELHSRLRAVVYASIVGPPGGAPAARR